MRTTLLSIFILISTPALAEKCNSFEAEVFQMIDRAFSVKNNNKFKEYGWSSNGPLKGWTTRMRQLSDAPQMFELMQKYRFVLTDAYLVVDEYRTNGYLDSYFSDVENAILKSNRCSY